MKMFWDKIRTPQKNTPFQSKRLSPLASYCWELLMLVIGIFVLRHSLKGTEGMIGLSVIFAIIMKVGIPFRIW